MQSNGAGHHTEPQCAPEIEDLDFQTDPLTGIVDDFMRRTRSGESVSVDEYLANYPEMTDRLRQLLRMVLGLEQLRSHPVDEGGVTSEPFSLLAGQRLGDFLLVREIGRGGMGIVYEAIQESLARRVAVKLFHCGVQPNPMLMERFEREARAAAQLHHTNIVPVFAVGRESGLMFYAMQHLRGQSLDRIIQALRMAGLASGGPWTREACEMSHASLQANYKYAPQQLRDASHDTSRGVVDTVAKVAPVRDVEYGAAQELGSRLFGAPKQHDTEQSYFRNVAQLGMQCAAALAYAHEQGVLHRDIKPSNLFLDTTGTIWITDFGLAKAEGNEDLTASGDVLGTLRYMPPERLKGLSLPQGDVYSLGVTLREMLTLRPAYDAHDRATLIDKLLHEPLSPPSSLVPAIPRDLNTIVVKATAKDVRDRYATASEFAADLRRFLDDEPIHARPPGPVERFERWVRRNPTMTALAATILLSLVVIAVGSAYSALRIAAARDQEISARILAEQKSAAEQSQRRLAEEHLARALGAEANATTAALRSQREAHVAERVAAYLMDLFSDPNPYQWRSIVDEARANGDRLPRPELIAGIDQQMQRSFDTLRDQPDELIGRLQATAVGFGFLIPKSSARRILEQALTIGQRTQGLEHPNSTWTLFLLGKSFDQEGRPEFAEPLLRKSVAAWQRGGDDPRRPADSGNGTLGMVLLKKGRVDEAEACLREAVELSRQKNDTSTLASWLGGLASALERQGQWNEAQHCLSESAQLFEDLYGATDYRTLTAQRERATVLRHQQELASAEAVLRGTLAGWHKDENRLKPGFADALLELSRNLASQRRWEEAEQIAREAVAFASVLDAGYRGLRERASETLLDALATQGKIDEAEQLAARTLVAQWRNAARAHDDAQRIYEQALDLATAGDHNGYAAACQEMLDRFQDTESADVALTVARTCCLAANGLPTYEKLLRVVNWGIAIQPDNRHLQIARGAALYRAGEFGRAAESLLPLAETGVQTRRGSAVERFFLAASLAKLGDAATASTWYESGAKWLLRNTGAAVNTPTESSSRIVVTPDSPSQDPWRELRILQREVQTILTGSTD